MEESKHSLAKISLELSDKAEITVKKKRNYLSSFLMIGDGRQASEGHKMQTIDLLKEMEDMTKSEIQVINLIRVNVEWLQDPDSGEWYSTGVSYVPSLLFESIEVMSRRSFQKGMKLLHDKQLAIKLDRNTYMVNPLAVIPSKPMRGKEIWDAAVNANS